MDCTCGHDQAAHEHYHAGEECSLCDCPGFTVPWRDRIPAWLRRWLRGR